MWTSPLYDICFITAVWEARLPQPPAEPEPAGHQNKEGRPADSQSQEPLRPQDQESFTQHDPLSPL